jgi:ABC-2 type transport system permease protein
MTAALRYELRMQLRRPALWSVTAVTVVLLWLLTARSLPIFLSEDPRTAMIRAIISCNVPLPIGYAFLLADRLVRDERLGVAALLDATASSRLGRLLGKYLGCAAATALPVATIYFGFSAVYTVRNGAPQALSWALAMFATITVPALLFVGAVSLCGPLVMPTAVFRVLFVGYWMWNSYMVPPKLVPTLTQTVIYPMGGYPIQVFFGYHGGHAGGGSEWAGPVPGALFNALRPAPTAATAWLSIAIIVGLAALTVFAAHLVRERRTR